MCSSKIYTKKDKKKEEEDKNSVSSKNASTTASLPGPEHTVCRSLQGDSIQLLAAPAWTQVG